jgi:hypothetical protein
LHEDVLLIFHCRELSVIVHGGVVESSLLAWSLAVPGILP